MKKYYKTNDGRVKSKKTAIALGIAIPLVAGGFIADVVLAVEASKKLGREVEIDPSETSEAKVESKTTDTGIEITVSTKETTKIITELESVSIGGVKLSTDEYTFDKQSGVITISKAILDKYQGKITVKPIVKTKVEITKFEVGAKAKQVFGDVKITTTTISELSPEIQYKPDTTALSADINGHFIVYKTQGSNLGETADKKYTKTVFESESIRVDTWTDLTSDDTLTLEFVEVEPAKTATIDKTGLTGFTTTIPDSVESTASEISFEASVESGSKNGKFIFTSTEGKKAQTSSVSLSTTAVTGIKANFDEIFNGITQGSTTTSVTVEFKEDTAAADFEINDDGYISMTATCLAKTEAIEIPSTVDSKTVKGIANYGCYNAKATAITFAFNYSLIYIGQSAFEGCLSIESIALPENLKTIDCCAFKDCTNLKNVTFVEWLETINQKAFYNCSSLKTIDFGSFGGQIQSEAFSKCPLTSVTFDTNVCWYQIGQNKPIDTTVANTNAKNLTDTTTTGSWNKTGIEALYSADDDGCLQTTNIGRSKSGELKVPTSFNSITVKGISGGGFRNIKAKKVVFETPENITKIQPSAFMDSYIEEFEIPANLETFSNSTFLRCEKLTKLTFADGTKCKTFGEMCCNGCASLKSITIPATVTTIGKSAFTATTLESATFADTSKTWIETNGTLTFTVDITDAGVNATNFIDAWPSDQPDGTNWGAFGIKVSE